MKSETAQYQRSESESVLAIDDTLCEHVEVCSSISTPTTIIAMVSIHWLIT
ncbi:hypothetical protein KFU94_27200 [Chloroflexi bacterium TSY]|nr:hypothetical protein [Chloroflexi bacterium TSY]